MKLSDYNSHSSKQSASISFAQKFFGNDTILGYTLVFPLLLFALSLLIYPFISAFLLSLQDKMVGQKAIFIGITNYERLLTSDKTFPLVVRNTLLYTFSAVAMKLIIGMGMALMLKEIRIGSGISRGLLLIPWIVPDLVVAMTWRWMFDGTFGVINYILMSIGVIDKLIPWLSNYPTAMGAAVIANIWRGFPFFGITLLAGLQTIPTEQYEAAEMDGASVFKRFWYITVPGLRPVILVATILSTIWTFNDFTIMWVMTSGGPSDKTHLFATYTFILSFMRNNIGYAMAVTVVMLPILVILILTLAPYMWRKD